MSDYSVLNKLSEAEINLVENWAERLLEASAAISACAFLLDEFQTDDSCTNAIPDNIKTDYVRGALIAAIRIANSSACSAAEAIDEHVFNVKNSLAKNRSA